jgi:hypothetical protein
MPKLHKCTRQDMCADCPVYDIAIGLFERLKPAARGIRYIILEFSDIQ